MLPKKQKKLSRYITTMWDEYVRYEIRITKFEQDWTSIVSDLRSILDQKGVKHRNISKEELEVFIEGEKSDNKQELKLLYIVIIIVVLVFLRDKGIL